MSEPAFKIRDFPGAVMLQDPMLRPDGRWIHSVLGRVSVYQDEELAGFRVKGNQANWAAVVDGPRGRVVVMGCQVRAVFSGTIADVDSTTCWDLT